MKRLALSFTVVPGSEPQVREILGGYERPELRVDSQTRLLRTSVFLGGNRVVRVVDIVGDVAAAMRHLAAQPQIQAVEQALNSHLEQPRDLTDPAAARRFFARASLPRAGGADTIEVEVDAARHAVLCPVRPGLGDPVAELLKARAGAAGDGVTSTVFHRDDVVVWLLEGVDPDTVLRQVGRHGRAAEADGAGGGKLANLLAVDWDLTTEDGFATLLRRYGMEQLTDRKAGA